jgi:hypothetical protein
MTSSGNDSDSEVVGLGTNQSDPETLFLFALLLLNDRGVRMNSEQHSTISAAILDVLPFFAPGKTFLTDQNQVVILHTDSKDSEISILISSGEMSNRWRIPQMFSDSKNHKPNVVLFKFNEIVK